DGDGYAPEQAGHVAGARLPQGLLDHQPVPDGDALPQEGRHQQGPGHDAQAASLDEEGDDQLAEGRPGGGGVYYCQAGDADGGSGGEEGVQDGDGPPILGGGGQAEEDGACQNGADKAQYQRPGWIKGRRGMGFRPPRRCSVFSHVCLTRVPAQAGRWTASSRLSATAQDRN